MPSRLLSFKPGFERRLDIFGNVQHQKFLNDGSKLVSALFDCHGLRNRTRRCLRRESCPCRSVALGIHAVGVPAPRRPRSRNSLWRWRSAFYRRRAGSRAWRRSLSTAGACPGEFEQGLYELAAFESLYVHQIFLFGDRVDEIPVGDLLLELRFERFHD